MPGDQAPDNRAVSQEQIAEMRKKNNLESIQALVSDLLKISDDAGGLLGSIGHYNLSGKEKPGQPDVLQKDFYYIGQVRGRVAAAKEALENAVRNLGDFEKS